MGSRTLFVQHALDKSKDIPKIGLKILISRLNVEDSLLAIDEALKLGVDYLQFNFLGYPEELVLPEDEIKDLTNKIQKQIDSIKVQSLIAELVPAYKGEKTYKKCLMTFLHPLIDWNGEIYICAFFEHRKKNHSIGHVHNGGFFKHWNSPYHREAYEAIDPETCIPNCPMLRYNPVIDFIKSDCYRFPFI